MVVRERRGSRVTRAPSDSSVWRNATGLPIPQKPATGSIRAATRPARVPPRQSTAPAGARSSRPDLSGKRRASQSRIASSFRFGNLIASRQQDRAGSAQPAAPVREACRAGTSSRASAVASRRSARRRGRGASRRCWKPSSSTSSSLSSSSTARARPGHAIRVLQVRHVRQVLFEHHRLVVPARHRHRSRGSGSRPEDRGRGRTARRIRRTASCRCRRASGCRRSRPARRPDGSSSNRDRSRRFALGRPAPYGQLASRSPSRAEHRERAASLPANQGVPGFGAARHDSPVRLGAGV